MTKKKKPYLSINDIVERIDKAAPGVGHEDEKLPKKFDRNTGAIAIVEDIDFAERGPLKYE